MSKSLAHAKKRGVKMPRPAVDIPEVEGPDVEPTQEPIFGAPSDDHTPPLDDPADLKYLKIGDPRLTKPKED